MISSRRCAFFGALFFFFTLSSQLSAQTTRPLSHPSFVSTTTSRPSFASTTSRPSFASTTSRPSLTSTTSRLIQHPSPTLRCALQCGKSFGYTALSAPKSKQHLCVAALVQRAQNCRNDLALLEANMRKKLDDAETRCKTHCGTNEPCFSACTNVFSARTAQFEQTLTNLHPLCNAITAQIPTCFPTPQPPHQQKPLLACLSRCKLP